MPHKNIASIPSYKSINMGIIFFYTPKIILYVKSFFGNWVRKCITNK